MTSSRHPPNPPLHTTAHHLAQSPFHLIPTPQHGRSQPPHLLRLRSPIRQSDRHQPVELQNLRCLTPFPSLLPNEILESLLTFKDRVRTRASSYLRRDRRGRISRSFNQSMRTNGSKTLKMLVCGPSGRNPRSLSPTRIAIFSE